MSSEEAMEAHNGGVGTYRASEGKSEIVSYKGPVSKVLQEITGGLRSACAYVGARTLKDFPKCATFVIRR
jgi:GMP reductase